MDRNILILPWLLWPALTACGTYGGAKFQSAPSGARIVCMDDSSEMGVTPFTYTCQSESGSPRLTTYRAEKTGYLPQVGAVTIRPNFATPQAAAASAVTVFVQLQKE